MTKKSVIYIFSRDEKSVSGFMSSNRASTDAAGVVLNWAAVEGRSYQTMLDQDDFLIAQLTYDEERAKEAADDLNQRCGDRGLKRETITEMQVDKLRGE